MIHANRLVDIPDKSAISMLSLDAQNSGLIVLVASFCAAPDEFAVGAWHIVTQNQFVLHTFEAGKVSSYSRFSIVIMADLLIRCFLSRTEWCRITLDTILDLDASTWALRYLLPNTSPDGVFLQHDVVEAMVAM